MYWPARNWRRSAFGRRSHSPITSSQSGSRRATRHGRFLIGIRVQGIDLADLE